MAFPLLPSQTPSAAGSAEEVKTSNMSFLVLAVLLLRNVIVQLRKKSVVSDSRRHTGAVLDPCQLLVLWLLHSGSCIPWQTTISWASLASTCCFSISGGRGWACVSLQTQQSSHCPVGAVSFGHSRWSPSLRKLKTRRIKKMNENIGLLLKTSFSTPSNPINYFPIVQVK